MREEAEVLSLFPPAPHGGAPPRQNVSVSFLFVLFRLSHPMAVAIEFQDR